MNPCDAQEFALHPDRQEIRAAIESFEVDPSTDVIALGNHNNQEDHTSFTKGNLADALVCLPLKATTVIVRRNGEKVFRWDNIRDLFGSVFF
jgi:hypothetical protein